MFLHKPNIEVKEIKKKKKKYRCHGHKRRQEGVGMEGGWRRRCGQTPEKVFGNSGYLAMTFCTSIFANTEIASQTSTWLGFRLKHG